MVGPGSSSGSSLEVMMIARPWEAKLRMSA